MGLGDELIWSVVDRAPDAIVMVDQTGRILLVNRQTEDLFGYERSELLGRPVEELLPEQFRQLHRAHRTRYQAEPRTRTMGSGLELLARRKDGLEVPVEVSLSPLSTESGSLVVAAIRDISERVAAEAVAKRVSDLLNATRDAIFIFDPDTLRFSYVNDGAIDQVGYSRDELLTMTMLHLAPELTADGLRKLLAPTVDGAHSTMFSTVYRRCDGVDLPVEVLLQAGSYDGDGNPQAFVMIVRDVTERVEADRQLHRAAEELGLAEERERIARDLHDTVIQRLFAAGMTLQAVSSMVGTGPAAARLSGVVDELDETIRELRTAIYDLRTAPADRRLRAALLEVIDGERDLLGLDPTVRFSGVLDALPDAIAPHLLATLREMLSNVGRHAAATAVEIDLEADGEVVLRVTDDGVGIDADNPAGNGLANMAARAEGLGGTCTLSARPGGGTTVEWRVPNRDA